jgi:hypothetical protein
MTIQLMPDTKKVCWWCVPCGIRINAENKEISESAQIYLTKQTIRAK